MPIPFPLKTADLEPPSSLYVTKDDVLFVTVQTSDASTTEFVAVGRMMQPDGQIIPFVYRLTAPATDRSASTKTFNLDEGFLLALTVGPLSSSTLDGRTAWCLFGIMRGGTSGINTSEILGQGYCGKSYFISWPPLRQQRPLEGPGRTNFTLPAQPALGAELLITVPTNAVWYIKSLYVKLVASATAATRIPFWQIKDPNGNPSFFDDSNTSITASLRMDMVRSVLLPKVQTTNTPAGIAALILGPLPTDMFLHPGSTLGTTTAALQATDQYTILGFNAEEWLIA